MLCLMDRIRDDDPSVPYLLRVLEDAGSLTALLLAAWQGARVLAVQFVDLVLDERARQPTAWLRPSGDSRSSGPAGNSSVWAVPSRSVCLLRPRPGGWGGIGVGW
jgi:hypothetical protein